MKLQSLILFVLFAGMIACNDDDDGDVNQTQIGDDSQVTAEISQDGDLVTNFQSNNVAGPISNGVIVISTTSGQGTTENFTMTIATDGPEGSYSATIDQPSAGQAVITYSNVDIQNGIAFASTSGQVQVDRYEQVGENEMAVYYEMDGSFDVTAEGSGGSGNEVQITGSFENVFITEEK